MEQLSHIYDIDGTFFSKDDKNPDSSDSRVVNRDEFKHLKGKNDLWLYTHLQDGDRNAQKFLEDLETWNIAKNKAFIMASFWMFQESLQDFRLSPEQIREKTKERVLYMCEHGMFFRNGINFIRSQIDQGESVTLSTTNFVEGAEGAMDALEAYALLSKDEREAIHIAGTEVDWVEKEVIHFNVDIGKLLHANILGDEFNTEMRIGWNGALREGLSLDRKSLFRLESHIREYAYMIRENIQEKDIVIGYAAGDQPEGNDAGLADLAGDNFLFIDPKLDDPWKKVLREHSLMQKAA